MTTNTTNSQAASFRAELLPILRNMYLHFEPDAIDDEICSVLDMIDAKLAQVEQEAYSKGADNVQGHAEGIINRTVKRAEQAEAKLAEWDKIVEVSLAQDYATRAIAAESRLAEIQRGVEGLPRFAHTFGRQEESKLHTNGLYLNRNEVLALLQPQGQANTSGLPG